MKERLYIMKDVTYVRAIAQNCIEELHTIGIYPNITPDKITINTRLKSVWGRCWTHWENNSRTAWHFTIEISSQLCGDNVPDNSIRKNLLHEMLHACDECVNEHHGGKWAEYAELVNDCYGLNIKRCTSSAEYHVEDTRKTYRCKCSKCGKIIAKKGYRAPKWYLHPQGYTHTCADGTKNSIVSEYYGFKNPTEPKVQILYATNFSYKRA